jgi:hypothetical protein
MHWVLLAVDVVEVGKCLGITVEADGNLLMAD